MYNAVLALSLLHAALLGFTLYAAMQSNLSAKVWLALLLVWPLWLVALVALWFCGDRKLWRLFVPVGLGVAFIVILVLGVAAMISGLEHGSMG